ncbi:MAG: hypothetical protein ACI4P4_03795 [Faecousia sp.]
MMNKLQQMVSGYGLGITVERLASDIYWQLVAEGEKPCIVNSRYIEIDGVTYQFRRTRSKGCWTVVEF